MITVARKTENDMSVWSDAVEEEREAAVGSFVTAAKEICARIKAEGAWADFVDPGTGTPFYGPHASTTMFETDDKYRLLGFSIEDLGCCKVISHCDFGTRVFVGTIFTDAHPENGVVEEAFADLGLNLAKR